MNHPQELAREALRKYCRQVDDLLAGGSLAPYAYEAVSTKEQGTSDAHYTARLRLVYGLHFYEDVTETSLPPSSEPLVRQLFLEELQDRQTNSFQGIGDTLELLTKLLSAYGKTEDKALFSAAKKANFDCACGYDPESYDATYFPPLAGFELDGLIDLMTRLAENSAAKELLRLWTSQQKQWTHASLAWLSHRQKRLGLDEEELVSLEKMAALSRAEDANAKEPPELRQKSSSKRFQLCSDLGRYGSKLGSLGYAEKALAVVWEQISHMEENWYNLGLGRSLLELSMELILAEAEPLTPEACQKLWQWACPHLLHGKESLHWNLYRKIIRAADKLGEPELSAIFQAQLEAAQAKYGAL